MPIGGASNGRGGAISADRHHDVLQVPLEVQRQGARLHDLVDLLTILMAARDEEAGESMSDAQLTMMIAGHETTANALSWLWVLLDRHPAEQERLREELTAATGGRPPTVNDLPGLPRLKATLLETLRLYPPVWMFDRRAIGPDDLAGTPVRAGDLVIFCPYALHRLPDLWNDPEEFRPERFEAGRRPHNSFAYLPFSAGPRICLGNNFALIESQIIVGTLLSQFRVRLADSGPITPEPRVTLRTSRTPRSVEHAADQRIPHAPLVGDQGDRDRRRECREKLPTSRPGQAAKQHLEDDDHGEVNEIHPIRRRRRANGPCRWAASRTGGTGR
jgi:cytochrome P450